MSSKFLQILIRLATAVLLAHDLSIFITNMEMVNAGMGADNRGWHHFLIGKYTYQGCWTWRSWMRWWSVPTGNIWSRYLLHPPGCRQVPAVSLGLVCNKCFWPVITNAVFLNRAKGIIKNQTTFWNINAYLL